MVGWAQARFGGKRLWMFALLIFLAGSIASSLAWSASSLIAFRVVQGVGGGIMLPLMSTLVMQAAGGKALGRAMSVVSLPAVLGPIVGPVLGGMILNWLDWRWLFWVNVPLCVIGLFLACFLRGGCCRSTLCSPGHGWTLGESCCCRRGSSEFSGASRMPASWVGFSRVDVLAPMLIGAALRAAFAIYATWLGERALVDVRLFAHRAVASASALLFLSGAALYGALLLLPLYFQDVRGADPLGAGLLLVPQGIGTLLSRSLAGRLTDRIGPSGSASSVSRSWVRRPHPSRSPA